MSEKPELNHEEAEDKKMEFFHGVSEFFVAVFLCSSRVLYLKKLGKTRRVRKKNEKRYNKAKQKFMEDICHLKISPERRD